MAPPTVAEALIETLAGNGVRRIYGITGDSLNALSDALRRSPKDLGWVHTRHEEAAAFAAAAEAHLTGRMTVCAGSCGPGNLHLINGLYDAHRSRVPVLAIASQIPTAELGSDYFQETHPERLLRECTAYVETVGAVDQFARVLDRAIRTAIGERDTAAIVLPGDIAWQEIGSSGTGSAPAVPETPPAPSDADVERALAAIGSAEKITILAGAGCAGAHAELIAFARALNAPIVHTMRGKEYVEPENPFDVGMTGLLGFASGYRAMQEADLLILLGTDFPYRQFYPERAVVVQVDGRAEAIGRRTHVEIGVVADVRATLAALTPRIAPRSDRVHLATSLERFRKTRAELDGLAQEIPGKATVHPQLVARIIDELAAPDAIFSCDVGTPTIWAARYLRFNGQRRIVGSFNHGSMANALPHAIGAQASHSGRQVISLSGDGGLSMLLGELLTLRQNSLPVKVVVFNNGVLGFVALEMVTEGLVPTAVDLVPTNFAQLAQAAGILGIRAERPEDVRPALTRAFETPGPALVDVVVQRLEVAMPPKLSWAQFSGFSLFLAKAVLGGHEGEVVDLTKGSLFR